MSFVFVFFFSLHYLKNLDSLTRDQTQAPCSGSAEPLTTGPQGLSKTHIIQLLIY